MCILHLQVFIYKPLLILSRLGFFDSGSRQNSGFSNPESYFKPIRNADRSD